PAARRIKRIFSAKVSMGSTSLYSVKVYPIPQAWQERTMACRGDGGLSPHGLLRASEPLGVPSLPQAPPAPGGGPLRELLRLLPFPHTRPCRLPRGPDPGLLRRGEEPVGPKGH